MSRAPLGIWAPSSLYLPGVFRKLTNSMISALASLQPATSLNMVLFLAFLSSTCTCRPGRPAQLPWHRLLAGLLHLKVQRPQG